MRRVVILASLLACNGGNGDQDTGVVDTGFVDTGAEDTGGGDTGETGDTSVTLEWVTPRPMSWWRPARARWMLRWPESCAP